MDILGMTLLHLACRKGDIEMARLRITAGDDVNSVECLSGRTPLHAATRCGHTEIVSLLINQGADVNLADRGGFTPLYLASQQGHSEIVKLLVDHGARINDAAGPFGASPLHMATNNKHIKLVKLLIANGADPNLADSRGVTPLNSAIYDNHTVIMALLIRNVLLKSPTAHKPSCVENNEKASRIWKDISRKINAQKTQKKRETSTSKISPQLFRLASQEMPDENNSSSGYRMNATQTPYPY